MGILTCIEEYLFIAAGAALFLWLCDEPERIKGVFVLFLALLLGAVLYKIISLTG